MAPLSDSARGGFVSATFSKPTDVVIEILSVDGCAQRILDSLSLLGATLRFVDEKVGYTLISP